MRAPPAIMKGWIDRVFRPGVAYDYPPERLWKDG
jgi:putative NADPH-quinone reductase